ncbi:hypothetical protein, partial [Vibrio sp. Vb2880]|uniref:hypothetical protein n=1 Tax=Vibrio sp. Vb2880 TaxID=2816076 RepID=UPI001F5E0418
SEEDKVFEASVEMSFLFETNDFLKMRVVNVCVNSEQSSKDCLHHFLEVWRESCTCQNLPRIETNVFLSIIIKDMPE